MPYTIKEIYYTLQGEGAQVGRPAVFLRFTGCNLWSGRIQDRGKGTGGCSSWCDTDFVGTDGPGGGKFQTAVEVAKAVLHLWPDSPGSRGKPLVVCTGGEPLLQLDVALIEALHAVDFEVAIETNGTKEPPPGIDWICVSPKAGTELILKKGNELKLVYPQPGFGPGQFEKLPFDHFFLQPLDDANQASHIRAALEFCLRHPQWRLSLQTHKILKIA
jgi:7-carboxy-7-deazaguanine synthase